MTAIGTHQSFGYDVTLDTDARRRHTYIIGKLASANPLCLKAWCSKILRQGTAFVSSSRPDNPHRRLPTIHAADLRGVHPPQQQVL
jgi:hypothetical protein